MLPPNIESSNSHEASVLGYILGLKTTIWKTVLCKTQFTADCASHKTQDAFLGDIVILDTCDPNKHWTKYLSTACVNLFTKKERSNQMSSLLLHAASKHRNFSCPQLLGQSCQREGCTFKRNCSLRVITNTNRTFLAWRQVCGWSHRRARRFQTAAILALKCCDWRFWLAVKRIGTILHVAPRHGIATNQNESWNTHTKEETRNDGKQTEKKQMEIGRITTERRETKAQKWDQHTRNGKHREQKVKN